MAKVALLEVAINKYGGGNDLRGCHQDMLERREMLADMGHAIVETRELLDSLATLNNIRYGISQLFKRKDVDGYFLHFSGHGTNVKDLNGDETKDFGFVPHGWERDGFLLDDEMAELLKLAPANRFVGVFVDACHSESGQRGYFNLPLRVPNAIDIKPRLLHPAKHTRRALEETARRAADLPPKKPKGIFDFLIKRRSGSTGVLFTDTCLYWGAAQSDKTADDAYIKGMYRGAGTYYQVAAYRALRAEMARRGQHEQPTWEAINRLGNQLLAKNGHQHRMQLDGRKEVVLRDVSLL